MLYVVFAIVGYFFGCIQSSYILGRLKGIDIRQHGSKNAGASNAFMTMGVKYGVLVALIDILKAAIPVFLIRIFFKDSDILATVCGFFAVMGHVFPAFMGFRGGKGTASIYGLLLGLNPLIAVFAGIAIIAGSFASNYIAIGTLVMHIVAIILLLIYDYPIWIIVIYLLLFVMSMLKHMENFVKIHKGEETKLMDAIKDKTKS
jgi:acyl phosphate:glycerol-3-phosphate acyltransferase